MATPQRSPFRVVRRLLRARDVFGKPVRSDGVTVIPVASVIGGAGGGESTAGNPAPQGSGLGFGFVARPIGAFVIRDGKARWRPVIDVTPIALGALVAGVLVARWTLRKR
jgi:uncharacterized spore protein YtfJ